MQDTGSLMVTATWQGPAIPRGRGMCSDTCCLYQKSDSKYCPLQETLDLKMVLRTVLSLYNSLTSHVGALTPGDDPWRRNLGGCLG